MYVRLVFNSGPVGAVTICARLGYSAGVTSGTAWFDDLRVTEIIASDPHPRWKILVLIYDRTDMTYTDAAGEHHVIGEIDSAQVAAAAANAARFVQTDIPALSSGNMLPELTIRYPGALRSLTPSETPGGLPRQTRQPSETRHSTASSSSGSRRSPTRRQANCCGLAMLLASRRRWEPGRPTPPLIIEAATLDGHLNVFKHEWGHSLLNYYEAAGTAPDADGHESHGCKPVRQLPDRWGLHLAGRNGRKPDRELDLQQRFRLYSRLLFRDDGARRATRCAVIGITPAAWATGGPVSMPGSCGSLPTEKISAIGPTCSNSCR